MSIIQKIKNLFKKKPTLEEKIEQMNKGYFFNDFNEELIDEIYSILLDYGKIKVTKKDEYYYIFDIILENNVKSYKLTESGIEKI